jgi:ABC-type transporter Mla subunit MlaD
VGKKKQKASKERDRRNSGKKTRSDAGAKAIAKAEKQLERALRKLDEVRSELVDRENKLRNLLVKHGRMPADEPATEGDAPGLSTTYRQDGSGDDLPQAADESASVPLLDQRQILDVGSREHAAQDEQSS